MSTRQYRHAAFGAGAPLLSHTAIDLDNRPNPFDLRRSALNSLISSRENPDAGELIPGTGGIRKVRWSRRGSGKRGGVRVIYFYYDEVRPLYLLMVYAKARKENLTSEEARILRNIAAAISGK